MKNLVRKSGRILFFLSLVYVISCKKEKPAPPILSTTEVSAISYTTATSGGNVIDEGGDPVTSRGACWSTSDKPDITNSKSTETGGAGSFTSNLTQLTPNTVYYVRAYANNAAGSGYGNQMTFVTSQVGVPVLITTDVTSITKTSAVSGGNITSDNGGDVTQKGVCWNTNPEPTIEDNKSTDGTGTGVFTSSITGLTMGTIYYVRAYATNNKGTSYGPQKSFSTLSPPTVTTSPIEVISQTTATAGGNVTSSGDAPVTARGVCWSTSINPTTIDNKTSDNSGTGSFTSLINGLTTGTSYFVRAYATNSIGTAYGSNVTWIQKQSLVRLSPSGYNRLNITALTTPQTGILFEVKKEIFTQEALNQTTTAVLQFDTDTAILKGYNTAHSTTYVPLPPALGTTSPALIGGKITITFAPGETTKSVSVNIPNSADFDFSKQYALAFKLSEVLTGGTIDNLINNTVVVQIQALNKWDGVYTVTGTFIDYIGTSWGPYYPKTIHLITTGAYTCERYDALYESKYYNFDLGGGSISAYGGWAPYFMFDASDNVVDCVNSIADPLPRQRTALLYNGSGSINKYNSTSKTIDVAFQMRQLNVTPQIRNLITEHYVYTGPR